MTIWKRIKFFYWDSWLEHLYRYSWLYRLRWYLTHWIRKDHWIKTNLPIGYHDKPQLIEDGLFALVEDFVSKDGEDVLSKVFLDEDIKEKIIEILHWYRVGKPELQEEYNRLLHDVYGDRTRMWFEDCPDKPGYKEWKSDEEYFESKAEERKRMGEIEALIWTKTTEMLHIIIDIRGYLWT